jgi:fatty-acyl-CoA synthase
LQGYAVLTNKVPRVIEFVDSLPKSLTGKIMWRVLREHEDRTTQATLNTQATA